MARCSYCGYPLLPKHEKCPQCGAEISVKPSLDFDTPEPSQQEQPLMEQSMSHDHDLNTEDAALTKASIEKMRAEAGLYAEKTQIDMQKEQADFDALKQRSGFDIEKAEMEAALYGKRYVLEKQQAIDNAEMKGIELDADLSSRRKQNDYDFEQKKREEQFDFDTRKRNNDLNFDLEGRKQERDDARQKKQDERQFRLDDHQVEMENRREEQRRQRVAFDFDMDKQRKTFDFDMDKQKRASEFDFDQRGKDADAERRMKMDCHAQDMADRESRRRQEELEQKGNIAMRNMQAMMDAKRAARQDELQHEKDMQQAKFEAEERRMQTQKEMTAEQIMATQIREMDAGAQAKFAESFSAGKSADREREMAEEKARMYEQMMKQMTEMAKMGFQANANVATGRIDALRENIQPSAPVTPEPTPNASTTPEPPKSLRLNTSWLRQHGYDGSFNELAGQLANLGGDISQDFDEQGNPVIVVDQLTDAQVMEVLVRLGVKF